MFSFYHSLSLCVCSAPPEIFQEEGDGFIASVQVPIMQRLPVCHGELAPTRLDWLRSFSRLRVLDFCLTFRHHFWAKDLTQTSSKKVHVHPFRHCNYLFVSSHLEICMSEPTATLPSFPSGARLSSWRPTQPWLRFERPDATLQGRSATL